MVFTPQDDTQTAIQTVGYTVLAAPNVVVEVCVWPPKVAKQCLAISGMWWHCPQCPMVTLHAEDDVHTTVRHPNRN